MPSESSEMIYPKSIVASLVAAASVVAGCCCDSGGGQPHAVTWSTQSVQSKRTSVAGLRLPTGATLDPGSLEALARLNATWDRIRPEVERLHPRSWVAVDADGRYVVDEGLGELELKAMELDPKAEWLFTNTFPPKPMQ